MYLKTMAFLQISLLTVFALAVPTWGAQGKQAGYIARVKGQAKVVNQPLGRDLAAVEKLVLLVGDKVITRALSVVEIALAVDAKEVVHRVPEVETGDYNSHSLCLGGPSEQPP